MASGGHSNVWKCDWIKDGCCQGYKTTRRTFREHNLQRGKRDLDAWIRLRHGYVLPLYGVVHEFLLGTTAMVCPWLENGTGANFIASRRHLSGSHRL
ncbi:hypothetical protein K503DRAFT_773983 [Rhizopogon vinicolor AM-OR11-026]|uniref:Protein kinase domain-containing protein n=1 Tax=Rhizopogon vinicolor AM-OR11-026 TaxID=1314800 RepID=A0A1B7MQR6_9AGAM|nr:hypothetical protein K503DRAFT_773983 [Rhizopogon vinicolor AM-OR11-026]